MFIQINYATGCKNRPRNPRNFGILRSRDHNALNKLLEIIYQTTLFSLWKAWAGEQANFTQESQLRRKECLDYLADTNSPILTNEEQRLCEGQLTPVEVFDALSDMQANKTPGNDGLSKEFYLAFFAIICPNLIKCLNYANEVGQLSMSQRQAVITLIEKKGRDKRKIKSCRPISLLNVDAKILSKILASRVKKVISSLITSDQTAYIPGCVIRELIRFTSDLIEYSNIQNIPGYLVTVNNEKAFDSVDHTFLCSVFQKFGS